MDRSKFDYPVEGDVRTSAFQIKQDHGQCMPTQVDGHDMTIAECVNSGNWYDAVSRAAPEQLPQSELGF